MTSVPDTRFGGQAVGETYFFEVTGGAPALDFVNTLDEREGDKRELLTDIDRLIQWAEQVGLFAAEQVMTVRNHIERMGKTEVRELLAEARSLREVLFDIFSAMVHAKAVRPGHLRAFNAWRHDAYVHSAIELADGGLHMVFGDGEVTPGSLLWRVVLDAEAILLDPERLARLRQCQGATCAWLFLDYSRQKNRRWCDMSVCGNRAKVKRYRAKS